MTSLTTKFRNFSANSGSKSASFANRLKRSICTASRLGSAGGKPCVALYWPTRWVHLKRSARRWMSAASMLSMNARSLCSSPRAPASIVDTSAWLILFLLAEREAAKAGEARDARLAAETWQPGDGRPAQSRRQRRQRAAQSTAHAKLLLRLGQHFGGRLRHAAV